MELPIHTDKTVPERKSTLALMTNAWQRQKTRLSPSLLRMAWLSAIFNEFNQPLIAATLKTTPEAITDDYAKLIEFTWIGGDVDADQMQIHDVMREVLLNDLQASDADLHEDLHRAAAWALWPDRHDFDTFLEGLRICGAGIRGQQDEVLDAYINHVRVIEENCYYAPLLRPILDKMVKTCIPVKNKRLADWGWYLFSMYDTTTDWRIKYDYLSFANRVKQTSEDNTLKFRCKQLLANMTSLVNSDFEAQKILLTLKNKVGIVNLSRFESALFFLELGWTYWDLGYYAKGIDFRKKSSEIYPEKLTGRGFLFIMNDFYADLGQIHKHPHIYEYLLNSSVYAEKTYGLTSKLYAAAYTQDLTSFNATLRAFFDYHDYMTTSNIAQGGTFYAHRWAYVRGINASLALNRIDSAEIFLSHLNDLLKDLLEKHAGYRRLYKLAESSVLLHKKQTARFNFDLPDNTYFSQKLMAHSINLGCDILENVDEQTLIETCIRSIEFALSINCFIGEIALNNIIKWCMRFHGNAYAEWILGLLQERYAQHPNLIASETATREREKDLVFDPRPLLQRMSDARAQLANNTLAEPPLLWMWV